MCPLSQEKAGMIWICPFQTWRMFASMQAAKFDKTFVSSNICLFEFYLNLLSLSIHQNCGVKRNIVIVIHSVNYYSISLVATMLS